MSDIYQILIGIGVILAAVLFIIWHFRAPKGIGKVDPERPHTNIKINSSTSFHPESMNSWDKID